jgi:tetratricopeptide (TPR) repeat protein
MKEDGSNLVCRTIQRSTGRWRVATALLAYGMALRVLTAQSGGIAGTRTTVEAEDYLRRGEAAAASRDFDQAIADYNTAIRLRPDYAEAYNDRGHAYHWKGGNFDRAIADFTRAIELRPNYPTAYNNRGVVYLSSGHAARGIPDFDRALELNPNFRNAYVNRANARLRLLRIGAALDDFHRADMYPEQSVAILGGGLLLAVAGIVVVRRTRSRRARRSV